LGWVKGAQPFKLLTSGTPGPTRAATTTSKDVPRLGISLRRTVMSSFKAYNVKGNKDDDGKNSKSKTKSSSYSKSSSKSHSDHGNDY
jgi:hypothetical protein